MSHEAADRFRVWFEYERDSHTKTMESLHAVPEARRSDPAYRKAVTLMAHIIASRQLWLFRMGLWEDPPRDFFPEGDSLAEIAARLSQIQGAWTDYLARLDATELQRVFQYQSMEGPHFHNTVEDILTQLFGHSWYHRGQIAALVRSVGAEPAVTDFVLWSRRPASPPT